jgi:multidrug efflux pump subunit AcrA (membrane-fusion protein)
MRHVISSTLFDRKAHIRRPAPWLLFGLLAALAAPGCHHGEENHYTSVAEPPTVQLLRPPTRDIVRVVGQPSFIEAYERTSIYPKLAGYIKEWKVDIGDKVKKDEVLATLFIPELVEEHGTKGATVVLDQERIALANEVVRVAKADVEAAGARVEEAKAELNSYQAEVNRWGSEVKRLERERDRGIVTPQDVLQATNRLKASTASRDAARSTVVRAEAELLSRRAAQSRAEVDVRVAEADLKVAVSEEMRLKALVGYITLPAPFPGVIVARNANTFDFVLPTTGDPSADPHVPHLSPSGAAAPVYVVDRTDIVRIFVDVPEQDANYVHIGSKATVLVQAFRDQPIQGSVTRTSWALNVNSRTLRAEIDLKNPGSQLLPGMYAYAKVIIERPKARALPVAALMHLDDNTFCELKGCKREHSKVSALTQVGEKTYCWLYNDGHSVRTEVRTGINDGEWIEVTGLQRPSEAGGADRWVPLDGKEQVILGDLSLLADGGAVTLPRAKEGPKVASRTLVAGHQPAGSH